MKIIFLSFEHFEPWDWTNAVEKGIGGSETHFVEMAWRLARRGYEVLCYAPVPWEGTREWRGTTWTHTKNADYSLDGLWVLSRCPVALESFGPRRPEQPRWLVCQDVSYGDVLSPARIAKLDRAIPLCSDHVRYLAQTYKGLSLWQSTNGVKTDLFRELDGEHIPRNPKKLMYASSPDRGLASLLRIFKRARALVTDLELHVFYGFDNINKVEHEENEWARWLAARKREVLALAEQPGVILRGRVDQPTLYREWLSAGLWVYPTEFTETSCITCMEAQAGGAIPIFAPLWALKDNVAHGIMIDGPPSQDLTAQASYVGEIVRLTRDEEGHALQARIRAEMIPWARDAFHWERIVDQWDCEIAGVKYAPTQFAFQFKHKRGRVLNVGANDDGWGLRESGAVNMDVCAVDPVLKRPNKVDILHDARQPFPSCVGTFDTVILGDIMEHIQADDWGLVLANCRAVLNPGGRLVMTCPDDDSGDTRPQPGGQETYAERCACFHMRRITHEEITRHVERAGFSEIFYQPLDYGRFTGHAIVAEAVAVPVRVAAEGVHASA